MNSLDGRISVCSLFLVLIVPLQIFAIEPRQFSGSLDRLANAIKRWEYKRVGVAPSFPLRDEQRYDVRTPITTSSHGLYFAKTVHAGLVDRQDDDFEVVNADILMNALQNQEVSNLQDLEKLQAVARQVGGLDAIVVGTVAFKGRLVNGIFPATDVHLDCSLVDVSSGADKQITRNDRPMSLADAVYAGKSIEVMRYSGGGLIPIGFAVPFRFGQRTDFPLNPAAPEYNFSFDLPHPVANPKCPYQLRIFVEGVNRKFVYHPQLDDVYVPLDPGESFSVRVTNKTNRKATVVAYVDGINILRMGRELPDQDCRFWGLNAKAEAEFSGFHTRSEGKDFVEPFRIVPFEEGVAPEQNFTDHLGLITVVVCDNGWPRNPSFIKRKNRVYDISRKWNPRTGQWEYSQGWKQLFGAAPGGNRWVAGKDARRPTNLTRSEAKKGPILAALTVRYATHAEIDKMLQKLDERGR